jgi:hypothetical protein
VFQLAANTGTSVEVIESFYGKKRMRDPKMATEVTQFRGGDHTTKLHHTIYSLRHTAIRNAHDTVRGSGLISSISPRMRALFPAWSSADHLVNSSGLSKNVRLSPSIVIDKFDDCGSCPLTLFFHDPVARSVMMPTVTWVATECARRGALHCLRLAILPFCSLWP